MHQKTNKEILEQLSRRVIGHDYAKKVLINLVNRSKRLHLQRYALVHPDDLLQEHELPRLSNCLLIGDSGTGKTFLIETLSEIMEFPYIKFDATEFNPTGASGGLKKKDIIERIKDKAKEYHDRYAPRRYWSYEGTLGQMVVFVDEVDKLGARLSSDWNEHVQANFLTLFENKDELPEVTFIFAGAFTGMDKYNVSTKKSIGFDAHHAKAPKQASDLSQGIIQYGLLPELVGRLQHIVLLDELGVDTYKTILTETLLPKVKNDLKSMGVKNFKLNSKKIEEMANIAKDSGLGVRSLQTELSKLLVDIEFEQDLLLAL